MSADLSRQAERMTGTPDSPAFDLNGVRMSPCISDPSGVVSDMTVMIFEQDGDLISARYRGGAILDGYLLGHISAGDVHFRYVQAQDDGRLDAGFSNGKIERLPDGRLRLVEHFEWHSREGGGTNIFEEMPGVRAPEPLA